jgi:hypothetical protein
MIKIKLFGVSRIDFASALLMVCAHDRSSFPERQSGSWGDLPAVITINTTS